MSSPVISPPTGRCHWCGRFVPHDTPHTTWRVRVAPENQQVPGQPNVWARVLCPNCAANAMCATTPGGGWELTTFDEALARAATLNQTQEQP